MAAKRSLAAEIEAGMATEARVDPKPHLEAAMPPGVIRSVLITKLMESPTNPRRSIGSITELAESISAIGVLQPLLVRPLGGDFTGFEVVFGHRRLHAAKKAGLSEVPCDVRPLSDVQVLEAQLVENLQRADIQPIDEAEAFERLQKAAGYSPEQLADRTGKSKSWVYSRLKLLALGPEGRKALTDSKIHPTVAVAIARIPSHKAQAKAVERACDDQEAGKSVSEQLMWLRDAYCRALKNAPFDTKDDMLLEGCGSCLKCPKNSANAPKGLFEDLQKEAIPYCTDMACWDGKATNTWTAAAAKYEAKGAKVLAREASKKLFTSEGTLNYGTKYVEASRPVMEDKQKRSWKQLLAELDDTNERPQLIVAAGPKGKPVELYLEAEATAALAEHGGVAWAEKRADFLTAKKAAPAKAKESAGAGVVDLGDERRLREELAAQLVHELTPKMTSKGWTLPVARRVMALVEANSSASRFLEEYRDKHQVGDWVKFVEEKADKDTLLQLIVGVALEVTVCDVWSGFGEELVELSKAHGVDLVKRLEATKGGAK